MRLPIFADDANLKLHDESQQVFDGDAHALLIATYQGRYVPRTSNSAQLSKQLSTRKLGCRLRQSCGMRMPLRCSWRRPSRAVARAALLSNSPRTRTRPMAQVKARPGKVNDGLAILALLVLAAVVIALVNGWGGGW
jgi:hypothetical protein